MDPSKPNDPRVDYGQPIPRPRTAGDEVLEGEIIDRGVPVGRPRATPTPEPAPKKSSASRRTVLWTLLAIAAFVCLGGLAVGYVYYDKATTPDTRTPGRTFEEYLDARFNDGTPERLRSLTCGTPNLGEFDNFVSQLAAREADSGHEIKVNASGYDIRSTSADKAEIETDLVLTAGPQNAAEYVKQRWHFDLVRDDGWRVCGAHRAR